MKIALIMAGDLRCFTDCYPSLESNILNYNECDLYLHLYDDPLVADAIRILSPKKYLVEDRNKVSVSNEIDPLCYIYKPPETDPQKVFSQWRNVQTAFNLIDSDSYDMVIKTRYDIKYTNPLKANSFDVNSLNIPMGGDWRGGLFDMIAWGSYSLMSQYCSLYQRINQYVKEGVPCHPELLNRRNNQTANIRRCDYTVLLRKKYDRDCLEDKIFTLTNI